MGSVNPTTPEPPMLAIARKHYGDDVPQTFYLAAMELLALHDASVSRMRALLERSAPFLHDAGAEFDDDGSNEPLELALEIDAFLAEPELADTEQKQ
jgi:hypothetical protein